MIQILGRAWGGAQGEAEARGRGSGRKREDPMKEPESPASIVEA